MGCGLKVWFCIKIYTVAYRTQDTAFYSLRKKSVDINVCINFTAFDYLPKQTNDFHKLFCILETTVAFIAKAIAYCTQLML